MRVKEPNPLRGRRAEEPEWRPPKREEIEEPKEPGPNLGSLAQRLKKLQSLRDEKYELEAEVKRISSEIDELMHACCEEMDQHGVKSLKVDGIGTCSRTVQNYPSVIPGHEEEAFSDLRRRGYGSIIKETVHYRSLQSVVNEIAEKNEPPLAGVEVWRKNYIRITRSNSRKEE